MKPLPTRLLRGSGCVLAMAAGLALSACNGTSGYPCGGYDCSASYYGYSPYYNKTYYNLRGRYAHCHPDGTCHNMQHCNFYWDGNFYRLRPPAVVNTQYQIVDPPPRARPY
ncbi:hypothetical protein BTJ40_21090 [Microbulbifer sp. A4B17]|uniref:hypothetical protein n=1 Tax=Microbulbifer sp. A4B17 TaxID=359370 RepID=UPI000D52D683|nr:hypothetical protein [Microbulbifer sp. A4B17]AWF83107.1 hypothetical protein BTJ40_21090 [Microbulbifer sp. A4B17]